MKALSAKWPRKTSTWQGRYSSDQHQGSSYSAEISDGTLCTLSEFCLLYYYHEVIRCEFGRTGVPLIHLIARESPACKIALAFV
jgi:hypothetical protein